MRNPRPWPWATSIQRYRPRGGRTLKFRVESLELRELHTLNIQHSTLNTYRPPRGRVGVRAASPQAALRLHGVTIPEPL